MVDAYDKLRDDALDFPDDPRSEPDLDELRGTLASDHWKRSEDA